MFTNNITSVNACGTTFSSVLQIKKIKLSSVAPHMEMYGGVELKLQAFLTSMPDEGE
jgi:hypothetical protein